MKTIKSESERCLLCKKAQCAMHCPVGTPIPEVTELFRKGEIKKAGELLLENNPLSAITSAVCPHERNCFGHCVLGKKGEPVEFFKLENYISRYYLDTFELPEIEKKNIRVAVAGAGPAGLTMALILAFRGYDVTIFEAENDIGGVLRFGIPDFRLSKDLLEKYKKILLDLGVHLRFNTRIGFNLHSADLFMDGYKAVFHAFGTGRPNRLGLLGETLGHVNFAIDYLKSPASYYLGKKVAIIGAGNVAIDAARTAIRTNHAEVTLINRASAEDMTANPQEVELAGIDGVKFIHNYQVVRIREKQIDCVHVIREENEDGTITYKEDFKNKFAVDADSVILAIGQGPGAEIEYGKCVQTSSRGLIKVDENGETSTRNVFAAGDIVTGPSTVVEAVASAIKASETLLKRLEETD